jgi:hypothetical protein
MSVQRSSDVHATPLGPKYVDAVLASDVFCIPPLEAILLCIDAVAFPPLNLPLALHIMDLTKLPARATFHENLGRDLSKPVKNWVNLLSIEFVRPPG